MISVLLHPIDEENANLLQREAKKIIILEERKEKTGQKVCYKPAGGVSTTEEAVLHYTLVKDILGNDWLNNESFRFGASRLANNLLSSILGQEIKYF